MATNVDNAILEQFCGITGATEEVGVRLLEACNCNLDLAIGMHMDSGCVTAQNCDDGPTASDRDEEDEIRAPIPQRSETLVEEMPVYGFRGKRRKAQSVFDGFRDFQAEAKQQEEMLASGSSGSVSNKKRTLEDLFRPPIDITFKGTFTNLRDAGMAQKKWILVNVQNVQEFVCQALNRDVWSNSSVKAVIKDHFLFWQVYHDSEEGKKFCQFYKVNQWPFVAVVDPRTGENMSTWNKLDAIIFCELVTDFLMGHSYSEPSESSSPAAKRVRREPSIVDATEDEQLQAAMKASLNQTKVPTPVMIYSDSDDSNDIETFSGSEDEACPSPAKISPKKNYDKISEIHTDSKINDDRKKEKPVKSENDTLNSISSLSESESSMLDNTGSSDHFCLNENNYKQYLGKESDPQTSLMIRFPDGKRQQLSISCKSKLMALVLFVAENGFSNERYELVTNFPRRQLSYMDFMLTLENIGLNQQESIFVQSR